MTAALSHRALPRAFYDRPADVVARDLLGRIVVHGRGAGAVALRIVETEAYLGALDRASHAWNGRRTARNESMYLGGGHAYVYFIYGMHYCLNVVCGAAEQPHAVLLRAGEPLRGGLLMAERRGLGREARLGAIAGGPARLCEALAVDRAQDGVPLWRGELRVLAGCPLPPEAIAVGPRIGVDYAGEAAAWPMRFAARDNPHVSRPWPWVGRRSA
jgi:DNA-3-methyladenine glycosylase